MAKRATQEKIIEVIRDYISSRDNVTVVARRHDVAAGALRGWLAKAKLPASRPPINWGKVREEALR